MKKEDIVVTSIPNKFIGKLVLKYLGYSTEPQAHMDNLGPDQFPMYIHNEGICQRNDWSHGQNYGWVKNKPQIDWKEFIKEKVTIEELIEILWDTTDAFFLMRRKMINALDVSGYF